MHHGYHSDTMVSSIFALGHNGKGFLSAINFPSSWHDRCIMANIFHIQGRIKNFKLCFDQVFPKSGYAADFYCL